MLHHLPRMFGARATNTLRCRRRSGESRYTSMQNSLVCCGAFYKVINDSMHGMFNVHLNRNAATNIWPTVVQHWIFTASVHILALLACVAIRSRLRCICPKSTVHTDCSRAKMPSEKRFTYTQRCLCRSNNDKLALHGDRQCACRT